MEETELRNVMNSEWRAGGGPEEEDSGGGLLVEPEGERVRASSVRGDK